METVVKKDHLFFIACFIKTARHGVPSAHSCLEKTTKPELQTVIACGVWANEAGPPPKIERHLYDAWERPSREEDTSPGQQMMYPVFMAASIWRYLSNVGGNVPDNYASGCDFFSFFFLLV